MAEVVTERKKKAPKTRPARVETETPQPQIEEVPKQITFFQRIAAVPLADWGTRCRLTIYRLEPLIDSVRSSGKKYITVYDDGPPTEERIKQDHGSGRYRLYFGMKTAGASTEKEVDSVEIDILDPKYPPKLNLGDWLDDPKNRKWQWAKTMIEAEATKVSSSQHPQQNGTSADMMLDAVKTVSEIRRSTVEELRATNPPPSQSPADPIDGALKIVQLLKGGGESALLDMMSKQLTRAQERSEKLEDELRKRPDPVVEKPKTLLDQINELSGAVDGLKKLGIVPNSERSAIETVTRSKMGPWMEFFQPVLPEIAGIVKTIAGPLSAVAAQKMMQRPAAPAQQYQQPHAPNGIAGPQPQQPAQSNNAESQPQQNGAASGGPDSLVDFIQQITPPMMNHFNQGLSGDIFASWIADGFAVERVQQMQMAPPEEIVGFYKQTPYWSVLRDREARFLQFIQEFMAWKPESEEDEKDEPAVEDNAERESDQ